MYIAGFEPQIKDNNNNMQILYGLDIYTEKDCKKLGIISQTLGETKQQTVYEFITNMILEKLKSGENIIWRKPFRSRGLSQNFVTKKHYRGINVVLLSMFETSNPYWLTFKQVQDLKGTVKKGSKAIPIVFFSIVYKDKTTKKVISADKAETKNNEDIDKIPVLKYYNVFNGNDIEGIDFKLESLDQLTEFQKIETCESIVENMPLRPEIIHKGGDRAFYQEEGDFVNMPELSSFDNEQSYYSTLFHELIHSTGHKKRLNRFTTEKNKSFGSQDYAYEECIAEIGASFLCGESGILYFTLKNTAAYVKSWKNKLTEILKEDNKFIFKVSAEAQKASDFILNRKYNENNEEQKSIKQTIPELLRTELKLLKNNGLSGIEDDFNLPYIIVNLADGEYYGNQLVTHVTLNNGIKFESNVGIKCMFPVPVKVTIKNKIAKITILENNNSNKVKEDLSLQGTKNINGMENKDFGTVYAQFKDKPKEAIKHLLKVQEGECTNALYRDDIGYIDIVWGENDSNNKGFGLKHIYEKHGKEIEQLGFKIEDFIPIVVQYGDFNEKKSEEDKRFTKAKCFDLLLQ